MVLRELGLTFETIFLSFEKGEHKAPEFTKYNPNGRIPALIDHHYNDFVVWCVHVSSAVSAISLCSSQRESCAILLYLVKKYDPEHQISVASFDEEILQTQWLFYQASGQG